MTDVQSPGSSQNQSTGTSQPDSGMSPYLTDSRLWEVKIRYWTTVPVAEHLAAELFSAFLEVELPVYGFFDPELFSRDLVMQDTRFCSSLLVNSVLFWASVGDRSNHNQSFSRTLTSDSAHLDRSIQKQPNCQKLFSIQHSDCLRQIKPHRPI
jgi:hypothetical protein